MSLILEALNKADREDATSSVPDLGAIHSQAPVKRGAENRKITYLIAVLLGLILVVLSVIVVRIFTVPTGVVPPVPSDTTLYVQQEAPVLLEAPKVERSSPVAESSAPKLAEATIAPPEATTQSVRLVPLQKNKNAPSQSVDPEVAAIYAQREEAKKSRVARDKEAIASVGSSVPARKEGSKPEDDNTEAARNEALYQAMWNEVQKSAPNDKLQEAPERRTGVTAGKTLEAYTNIPFMYQMPEDFQTSVPSIDYSNHIYSPSGGAVIMNGKTLRENDLLGRGIMVQHILENGVILNFNNTAFKLSELTSWVNM
jgi:hypothetical protein